MAEKTNPPTAEGPGRPPLSLIHSTDLSITVIILAVCGALYFLTTRFEKVPEILAQGIPAQWFPRLLIWVIALLSLALPFEHRFRRAGREGLDEERKAPIEPITFATALLLAAVAASVPLLGTYLARIVATLLLPPLWGERRVPLLLLFAILFPSAVTLLFTQVLKVYFHPGNGEREQQGHGHGRAEPRQCTDGDPNQHPHENEEKVERLGNEGQALHHRVHHHSPS